MNFKIKKGDNLSEKEDDFIQLYNNKEVKIKEIMEKLDLSRSNFYTLRNRLGKQGKIKYRNNWNAQKRLRRVPKCIHKSTIKGIVYFQIKKGGVYYCAVKDSRDAIAIVEKLDKCGWNKSLVNEIKEEVCKV